MEHLHYFVKCRPQPGVKVYLVVFLFGTFVERNVLLGCSKKAWDLFKHEIFRARLFYDPDELMDSVSPVVKEPVSCSGGSKRLAWWCTSHHSRFTDLEVGKLKERRRRDG